MPFISFSRLLSLARTSNSLLNVIVKNRHPCFVPGLRGKSFEFSLFSVILAVGLSYMAFIVLRYSSSMPKFRVLSEKEVEFCQKFSSAAIEMIIWEVDITI
jgi:hypothetical protein